MAETRKVLGQSFPVAGILTALYTVPGATQVVVSTVTATNQNNLATALIRLSIAVAGAADTPAQYIVYDLTLDTNETRAFTIGATLGATDVIRVRSDNGAVSFSAFGVELT